MLNIILTESSYIIIICYKPLQCIQGNRIIYKTWMTYIHQKNFSGLHIWNPFSYRKSLPYMDRVGYKVPYQVNTIITTLTWTFGSLYSIPGLSKGFPCPYHVWYFLLTVWRPCAARRCIQARTVVYWSGPVLAQTSHTRDLNKTHSSFHGPEKRR